MSQNVWATIVPFGPVTIIFYWPKKKIRASQRLDLISFTEIGLEIIRFYLGNVLNLKR